MLIKSIIFMVVTCFSCIIYSKSTVLAQAGDVKIIEQNCNTQTFECDYVKNYKGTTEVLIKKWNRSAVPYQFHLNLIGLRLGLTGSPHTLTVYDSNNHKEEYFDILHVDAKKSCFINQEKDGSNKSKIVFYRTPSLKPYYTITRRDSGFKDFERVSSHNFDEASGTFNFTFDTTQDGEFYPQEVKVASPCSHKPKVTLVTWDDNRE